MVSENDIAIMENPNNPEKVSPTTKSKAISMNLETFYQTVIMNN